MTEFDNTSNAEQWFTYHEATNALTRLTNVPSGLTNNVTSFYLAEAALPTGQILITGAGNTAYLFTPDGGPRASWLPTISSVAQNSDGSYTLTGTQLTGLSEGGVYGDDRQESTNFPIVQLTAGSNVYYAKTYNPSTTAIGIESAPETVNFKLPLGLPAGTTYSLKVVASGIASAPTTLTTPSAAVDAPPTVAKPPSASPATVSGTTAALSILGADHSGESTLTYTWTTVSSPAGAPTPSFSANGTNAAKNDTVTFHAAGTYGFQAWLVDASGISVAAGVVKVTVNQVLSSIRVSPGLTNLTAGQTQQLSATGYDQFGNPLATQPAFTWSVSSGSGTVSSSGLFRSSTAGSLATVIAAAGSTRGSAKIGVVDFPWTSTDVGGPGLAGVAYDSAGTTTLTGSGGDIWGQSDQFHFDYQTLGGSGTIVAKVGATPVKATDGTTPDVAKEGLIWSFANRWATAIK